ncbi:MAG TPA: hypothetical protein VH302_02765 [Bryobacteraceae bacterium]|nr:hypothetical protein [Bryobacteraceae bacterium]
MGTPPVPPPTQAVTAQEGDTLCTLAIAAGYKDCLPLRALPANAAFLNGRLFPGSVVTIPLIDPSLNPGATEVVHRFRRRLRLVGIRFVHGSPTLPFDQDPSLPELNISNFVTTEAGLSSAARPHGSAAFPADAHFHQEAHVDSDAFKVEVLETRPPGGGPAVVLEVIRPTYDAFGNLTGHTDFTGADLAARTLNLPSTRMTARRFRTPYLRLVVDTVDQAALPAQTLLTTDLVPSGDPQVEILDQNVRATYIVHDCPAPAADRCRVQVELPINRGQSADLSVKILRTVPSGAVEDTSGGAGDNGIVKIADMRNRITTHVRRHWAQAHVKFQVLRVQVVDPPSDILTVGDATGSRALGVSAGSAAPGQVGFTVNVQRFGGAANSVHIVPPITYPDPANPTADAPADTANLIIAAINAIAHLNATVSANNTEVGNFDPSVDILIQDLLGGRVTITNLTPLASQDTFQQISSASVGANAAGNINIQIRNALTDIHVGHPEQRALCKQLDTGDQLIDIQVVNTIRFRGFTLAELMHQDATRRPVTGMVNQIIMHQNSADGTPNNPFSLPHEIGHILTDNEFHSLVNTELMTNAGTSPASTNVHDSKRIVEFTPTVDNWEESVQNRDADLTIGLHRIRLNAVARVQVTSADLLH